MQGGKRNVSPNQMEGPDLQRDAEGLLWESVAMRGLNEHHGHNTMSQRLVLVGGADGMLLDLDF